MGALDTVPTGSRYWPCHCRLGQSSADAGDPVIVACLGSSSTAGRGQAFGWIDELRRRPENSGTRFVNLGVGGDLAYDALRRVEKVSAARPDRVVVLIGANDVLALVFPRVRRVLGSWIKRSPEAPSPAWFGECLEKIAREVRARTPARLALCSLAPIGEDPSSTQRIQHELNLRVAEYSRIIRSVAESEGAAYIPFYERLQAEIVATPGRAFTDFRFLPIYRDTFRFSVLRQSGEQIAQRNGWRFHVDGVHLNRCGGMILADLIQTYLGTP
jgi:lysophospholipase L1-like esterase